MSPNEKRAGETSKAGRPPRLMIDGDKCQGHNRCHVLLAELITVDGLGFAHVAGNGEIPAALLDKARLAVRNCPEFALRLSTAAEEGDPE